MVQKRSLTFSGSSSHHLSFTARAERLAEIPKKGAQWFAPKRQPQVFQYQAVYALEPRELFLGTSPWGVQGTTPRARLESLLPSRMQSPWAQASCAIIVLASLVVLTVLGRHLAKEYQSRLGKTGVKVEAYVAPDKLSTSRKNSFVELLGFGRRRSSASADQDKTITTSTAASPTTTRKRTRATVSDEAMIGPSGAPSRHIPDRSITPISWIFQQPGGTVVQKQEEPEEQDETSTEGKGKWQWRTSSPMLSPLATAFPTSNLDDGGELGTPRSDHQSASGYFHRHRGSADTSAPDIRISLSMDEGEQQLPGASTPVNTSSAFTSLDSQARRSHGGSSSSVTSESEEDDDSGVVLLQSPDLSKGVMADGLPSPSMSLVTAMDATRTALHLHLALQARNHSDSGRSDSSGSSISASAWSEPVAPRSGWASPPAALGINLGLGAVGTASAFPGYMAAAQQHHLERFAVSRGKELPDSHFVDLPTILLPHGQRSTGEGLALALDLGNVDEDEHHDLKPRAFLPEGDIASPLTNSPTTADAPRALWT